MGIAGASQSEEFFYGGRVERSAKSFQSLLKRFKCNVDTLFNGRILIGLVMKMPLCSGWFKDYPIFSVYSSPGFSTMFLFLSFVCLFFHEEIATAGRQ